jgi:hypothetical protein
MNAKRKLLLAIGCWTALVATAQTVTTNGWRRVPVVTTNGWRMEPMLVTNRWRAIPSRAWRPEHGAPRLISIGRASSACTLQWEGPAPALVDAFILERSCSAFTNEVTLSPLELATVHIAASNRTTYTFTDLNVPSSLTLSYRLKVRFAPQESEWSAALTAAAAAGENP